MSQMAPTTDVRDSEFQDQESQDAQEYRVLSRSAVFALALAILSLVGLAFPMLLVIALAAAAVATSAIWTIRAYPNEYKGMKLAVISLLISSGVFAIGSSFHTYRYLTEVPEGHERIYFSDLQPELALRGKAIPRVAKNLDGKAIFLKGYMHPGIAGAGNVEEFVLVPDFGTCCFGGQPALTDMVLIHLAPGEGAKFSRNWLGIAGKFKCDESQRRQVLGLRDVCYEMEKASLR